MTCPICNIDLLLSEKKGIEIDYCPKCRGIWLDRGELDKIIELSQPDTNNNREIPFDKSRGQYNDHDDDDKYKYDSDKYSKNRKKSFLGDLFDF